MGQVQSLVGEQRSHKLLGVAKNEQTNKQTNTVVSHLHVESRKAKPIETESRLVVARAWEVGEMRRCWLKGTNFQSYNL